MTHYELLYIIPNQYTDEEVETISDKVGKIIKDAGSTITIEDNLGKKKLAYSIKQVTQGTYLLLEFDSEPENIAKIKKPLDLTTEVLRFQIVTKKKKTLEEIKKEQEIKEKIEEKAKEEETTEAAPAKEKEKVDIKQLDKKLEELLKDDIA